MTDDQEIGTAGPSFSDDAVLSVIGAEIGLAPSQIRRDQALVTDLGLDSLDFIKLVMAVEQALQIKIDDKEAAQIRIVEDLLRVARRAPANLGGGAAT
ncbi:MAG: acyl carrier protein [Rhodospirillaceae bacterium]|jgi:acyl carrier protein|nr:acyl carrier protein [Rhodospirillaceae bacterium]